MTETNDRTDPKNELSEDEQFALATKDNPLFADNAPDMHHDAGDAAAGNAPAADAGKNAGADDDAGAGASGDDGAAGAADDGAAAGDPGQAPAGADAGQGTASAAAAAAGAADGAQDPFPGYSTLSPEAREAVDKVIAERKKYENDYRALHGMTAPLQRGNEELRRQLQAQTARIQQLEQLERKQQDVSAAKDKAMQEFDEWAKQFPEESRAVLALVNPLREKVSTLEGSLQAARAELGNLHNERQQAALAREIDDLEKHHADWRQIHDSPEYWEWLERQTPGIQALNSSMYAGDAIQLLNLFKGSRTPAPQQRTDPAPQGSPQQPNAADVVQQRRNQQLARGTQPDVRGNESTAQRPANQPDMSDEDAQYAALVAGNPLFQ